MNDIYDNEYVQEILAQLPKGLTNAEFFARCQNDINQGWRDEVYVAYERYFKSN